MVELQGSLSRRIGAAEERQLRKLSLAGILTAAALLLSTLSVPFGPTRCFPFQHAVNAIAGVLLGPWWALAMAFITSFLRVCFGTGSLFAFPGAMPGALAVGLAYRYLGRDWAAFAEPLVTGTLGAWLASAVMAPAIGNPVAFGGLSVAFLISSVPGAAIGFGVLVTLRHMGVTVKASQEKA